jgi:CMP-N-acetylneuraminic acid synthetase
MNTANQSILAVIPARSGSKGVPKKNIRTFLGQPLIAHTIKSALESKCFVDVLVTTDSREIQDIALQFGAISPFLRPKELSHDTALATDTIRHAVLEYEKMLGKRVDHVMMLQPTTPTRTSVHICEAIKMFVGSDAESCMSVVQVDNAHPIKMKRIVGEYLVDFIETGLENPPRQLLPPVHIVNGAIYLVKRDILVDSKSFKGKKCIPYCMSAVDSVNIDSEIDFKFAEFVMQEVLNEIDS